MKNCARAYIIYMPQCKPAVKALGQETAPSRKWGLKGSSRSKKKLSSICMTINTVSQYLDHSRSSTGAAEGVIATKPRSYRIFPLAVLLEGLLPQNKVPAAKTVSGPRWQSGGKTQHKLAICRRGTGGGGRRRYSAAGHAQPGDQASVYIIFYTI